MTSSIKRLLIPSAALFWGLQFAFLQPALALLLVEVFHASVAEVGWVLAAYNASGFVATLALPAHADRTHDYLRPMLGCGLLTLALAGLLAVATTLPIAVIGLIMLGGPAGVGSSLLYAHLRHSGAPPSAVVNTRAIVSFAWVAGPPLAPPSSAGSATAESSPPSPSSRGSTSPPRPRCSPAGHATTAKLPPQAMHRQTTSRGPGRISP